MIDNSIIQEIKERLDIVEVVSDFISLKKSGSNYKALSPFTSEKTPSFFVSPSKQIFKCFSTGKGGDAIEFLREVDSMTYIEAIKYLGEKYGVEINEYEICKIHQLRRKIKWREITTTNVVRILL